jgi:hypothetical protein
MKKLIASVLLLFPILTFAQSHVTINRIDGQQGEKTGLIQHNISWDSKPLLIQGGSKAFKVSIGDSTVTGNADEAPELPVLVYNLTTDTLKMVFERTHLSMDTNMASGICLCSCYLDFVDVLQEKMPASFLREFRNGNFFFTHIALIQIF